MALPYVDAHCHLSTSDGNNTDVDIKDVLQCPGIVRCIMSSNPYDWKKLKSMEKSVDLQKSFGVHPWYCHLFNLGGEVVDKVDHYSSVLECKDQNAFDAIVLRLPDPIPLENYIASEFRNEEVQLIGEIGLDKLFRLPENGFYVQSEEPARLSSVRVNMSHQIEIFKRFCGLARENGKPISIHDVKCHGSLFEICVEEILPFELVNVCLHSFTGSPETLQQCWLRYFPEARLFFSLSKCINFKSESSGRNLVTMIPRSCILSETDYPIDKASSTQLVEQLEYVCTQITGSLQLESLDECKQLIYNNFESFLK